MTEDQAIDILERIGSVYPNFDLYEKRILVWRDQLKDMPYERVLFRLNKHISREKFPPTVADIADYGPPKNEFLEKVKEWEKDSRYAEKRRG
jgi:hypothetical protein